MSEGWYSYAYPSLPPLSTATSLLASAPPPSATFVMTREFAIDGTPVRYLPPELGARVNNRDPSPRQEEGEEEEEEEGDDESGLNASFARAQRHLLRTTFLVYPCSGAGLENNSERTLASREEREQMLQSANTRSMLVDSGDFSKMQRVRKLLAKRRGGEQDGDDATTGDDDDDDRVSKRGGDEGEGACDV